MSKKQKKALKALSRSKRLSAKKRNDRKVALLDKWAGQKAHKERHRKEEDRPDE